MSPRAGSCAPGRVRRGALTRPAPARHGSGRGLDRSRDLPAFFALRPRHGHERPTRDILNGMLAVKAHVEQGRLKLDEPTSLPEGEVVELVPLAEVRGGDTLDDEERAALHQSIEEGFEDFEKGDTEDAFEFLARSGSERPAALA
jgi:hypothetical protein